MTRRLALYSLLTFATGACASLPSWQSSPRTSELPSTNPAREVASAGFFVGYNEAWFGPNFGSDYTGNFDLDRVDRTFVGIKKAGGSLVRLWLFENRQGIQLNPYAPQAQGIDRQMLENIEKVMQSAVQHDLKIYFTLFDGNEPKSGTATYDYYYNLYNNKYREQDAFIEKVLTPVLQTFNTHPEVVFGLDLINEVDALISNGCWGRDWQVGRKWIATMRTAIRAQSPWLRVTASTSSVTRFNFKTFLTDGSQNISSGKLSGLGLDFYDLHAYSNDGSIPDVENICKRVQAEGARVILGEFGQKSQTEDDQLQMLSTQNFIAHARASCFSGALAWRYDSSEKFWSYIRPDGRPRPAVNVILAAPIGK